MEEASKVGLIGCPKCGNIVPEIPNFSVFQCGVCRAVLQAKNREIADDGLSEVSGEGGRRGVNKKGDINVNSIIVIRNEMENDDDMCGNWEEEQGQRERKIMAHSVRTRQGGDMIDPRFNRGRRTAFHASIDYRGNLRNSIDNPVLWNQGDMELSRGDQKFAESSLEDKLEGIRPPARSRRTMSTINDPSMERNGSVSSWGTGANVMQQGRFFKPPYSDEGPSNYDMSSNLGYGAQLRYPEGLDGLVRVAHLENDRAELLRKLDELKEQISKSGERAERSGERISAGRRPPTPLYTYARRDGYTSEGCPSHFEKQTLHSGEYFPIPPNLTRGHGRAPSMHKSDLNSNDSYPINQFPNSFAGYGDTYHPQMSRMPLYQQISRQYSQQGYVDPFPDRRMAFNQYPLMSQPHETTFHHPACSCSQCLSNNLYGLAEHPTIMPSIMRTKNYPYDRYNAASYHHSDSTAMSPTGCSSDVSHPYDQLPFSRQKSYMDFANSSFHRQQPRQMIVSKGGARVTHPMAGGAPFISCLHCFKLLKMPVSVLRGTNQGKVKCGACSSIFELECGTKGGFVLSVSAENKNYLKGISYFSDEVSNDKLESANDKSRHNSKISSCDGQDSSDYVPKQSLEERRPISRESEKRRSHHISYSSLPENEERPDCVIIREDVSHLAKPSLEHDVLPSHEDSLKKAHPGQLQSDDPMNLYGEVNKDESVGNKNVIGEQITSCQDSVKEAPVESEMDIPVNNYTKTGMSRDSTKVSKEGSKSRMNKFAGLMKKSLKDLTRSDHEVENEKSSILVNGHLIGGHLLKKAEKVAGPIQPGEYWYDYRTGFWGVMGHPCLGVIPPKMEEFKFPMPENCSNGNTKVFVNGRELHQEDLDLLSRRGLSITRHKYYLIEISGKVVDEQTGQELKSLGKLAPTVERFGHGFGMTVPKSNAQAALPTYL